MADVRIKDLFLDTTVPAVDDYLPLDGVVNGTRCILATTLLPVRANPSGLIGLTAVNGAATTLMRSDATPALSQAIAPTWTGAHTFTAGLTLSSSGPQLSVNDSGTSFAYSTFSSNGLAERLRVGQENSTGGSLLTGSSPYAGLIFTHGNRPIHIGVADAIVATFTANGINNTAIGASTQSTGQFTFCSANTGSFSVLTTATAATGTNTTQAATTAFVITERGAVATLTNKTIEASSIGVSTPSSGKFTDLTATGQVSVNTALNGTGTATAVTTFYGGSGAGGGPYLAFVTNSAFRGYLGMHNGFSGGSSQDMDIFAVSGNVNVYANNTLSALFTATGLSVASGQDLTLGRAFFASGTASTGSIAIKDSTGTTYYIRVSTTP